MEAINTNELQKLNSFYHSEDSTLSFIFGAKNTGKTTFLKDFVVKKNHIYINFNPMVPEVLFPQIAKLIANKFNIKIPTAIFNSFEKILELIIEQSLTQKLAIILDDFHTLLKVDKNSFDTLLKFYKKNNNQNLQFIITSSTYFPPKIQKNIEKNASLLFELEPFKFQSILAQPGLKIMDTIYIYSCMGSSNYLLSRYNKKLDFIKNMYQITLNPNSPYFNYGENYLNTNLSDITTYTSILYSIAIGNNKLGDIAKSLNLQSTYLTKYVQKLQDMMIIKKELPIDEKLKYSKLGRYFIQNNFLKFWFCYIFPNKSYLEMKKQNAIIKEIDKTIVDMIIIPSYKKILLEFLEHNAHKYLGYTPLHIGSWWDNHGNTIDIIAYNEEQITFIKVLWDSVDVNNIQYEHLKQMAKHFKTDLNPNYIIITKNTFINNF
jgi:AAA+ ATPase superfamily predicted ATPase